MSEPDATKTEITVMCPCCLQMFEIADARLALLAMHLAHHCTATSEVLHP